ncbi:MAG: hypothetical protein L3J20_06920 [Flavobacteriaceae bacterium]|nr:hypothetical protein [Flavobacteriaceae bacterium]
MKYYHIQRINGIRKEWNKGDYGETGENNFFKGVLEGIERGAKPILKDKRLIQNSRETLSNRWVKTLDYKSKDFENLF